MHSFIRLRLVAALLLSACFPASAEPVEFLLHNLHFRHFEAHGVRPGGVMHTVLLDSRDRLWMGTEEGLYLYDGAEVRILRNDTRSGTGLPNNFVKSLAEDDSGRVWIGTWGGGLAYYDESTRSVESADVERIQKNGELDFDDKIWSMTTDAGGRIWLGTFSSGLWYYSPGEKSLINVLQAMPGENVSVNRIESLHVDESDRLLVAPSRSPLHVFKVDSPQPQRDSASEQWLREMPDVNDIESFPDGRLLLSRYGSLAIVDLDARQSRTIDVPTSELDGNMMEALPYDNEQVLVGTGNRIWYVNATTGESFGLPSGSRPGATETAITWDMQLAPSGDILIAGTQGLFIGPAVSRQFWTIAIDNEANGEFLKASRALARTRTHLYVNSLETIYELPFLGKLDKPRRITGRAVNGQNFGRPLWLTVAPKGGFWSGTDYGFHYIDETGDVSLLLERVGVHTQLFDEKTQSTIFFAQRGLKSIRADEPMVVEAARNPVDAKYSFQDVSLHLSFGAHDDIWSGTFLGPRRYDRDTHAALPVYAKDASGDEWTDALVGNITAIDNNTVLAATGNGSYLAQLDETGAIRHLERLFKGTELEFMPASGAYRTDSDHWLLGIKEGLVKLTPDGDIAAMLLAGDGFPSYQPYVACFHDFDDGVALLSGELGPLLFRPADLQMPARNKNIVVTDVLSFRGNDTVQWSFDRPLRFLHDDKVIRFKFGIPDYVSPGDHRFEIRLRGFTEDWIDVGALGEFSFTNLTAGKYELELRARDGLVEIPPRSLLQFEVLPPWWLTWWAYALYALIVFGSLFLYWLSLQRKIEREREISARLREADRIKTHFLGELEAKVQDATQDLRHAVEALEIKNVELDAAQRRALDASRLKSEFLANMSHEIRTPMNGVLGFTQLLQKSDLDNDQRDYVETIEKSAHSLLGIINDVLDVSKIEAGKLIIDNSGFDLRECIADTLEALAPVAYDKNIELIGHVDESLPDGLRSDPVRLRQMLTNLVGNAVKFTDSGHVHVHVEAVDNERLRISVSDTGRGITPEDRDRLFQAFEQGSVDLAGRYTGTGLGLVITKKLCEAMGGGITLDSTPGKGTRITLELPLVVDRNPENRYGLGKPLAGRKVLLIDPHTQSREALRLRLAHWGADVTALADLVLPAVEGIDLAVIGVERIRLGDSRGLAALCARLPAELPRLALAATVDREALRSLGTACNATCLSKIGHLEGQARRIGELLGNAGPAKPASASGQKRLDGLHVLIADDNRINRWFLKKLLETHGARVTEADSGSAVLQLIDGDETRADIVLLDVHMPDMDGLEVARRLRAGGISRLPLLAVSANIQAETHEAALAAGINDYLLKPVEEDRLVDAVLEWTGRESVLTG